MILLFANTDWYLYNFRLALAKELRSIGKTVVFLSPPGDYSEAIQKEGFRWINFPLSRRGLNLFEEILTILRLIGVYRREKPELVHHFTIKCVLYGSIAAKFSGIRRVINSITGLGYIFINQEFKVRALRRFLLPVYRQALKGTRVIFQNPDDLALFQNLCLIKTEQTSLVRGSGVNMERFKVEPERPGIPIILQPGRMLTTKGVREFVEAAGILSQEGMSARFVLVGNVDSGNPDAISSEQLEEWHHQGCIEWWGWREDMVKVYQQAHVVCLPSYREGLPRVLIEAAACGRALIATDMPGCREVVHHGENGLLVPMKNPQALADAMRELVLNPDMRREMGRRGRLRVEEQFSEERVLKETLVVYDGSHI